MMRRNLLFALMLSVLLQSLLFCQDSPAPETYNGEPVCRNARGVHPGATYQPSPEYDKKARKDKVQGTVSVSMIVTTDGRPVDIKVTKSLTPGLDQQAIKAVSQWKFDPAMQDGKPCPMRVSVEVSFHLY